METRKLPDPDELSRFIAVQRSLNYPCLVGDETVYLVPRDWSLAVLVDDPAVSKIHTQAELESFLRDPSRPTGLLFDHQIAEASLASALRMSGLKKTIFADWLGERVIPRDENPTADESYRYSEEWADRMRQWSVDGLNEDRLPSKLEVCAIVHPAIAKSAALLYDRIYVPTTWGALEHDRYWEELPPPQITFGSANDIMVTSIWGYLSMEKQLHFVSRKIAEHYQSEGFQVVPGYHTPAGLEGGVSTGNCAAYLAAFNNIPLVHDSDISWEQVIEFRKDEASRIAYREFREWLRYSINAQTADEAQERIGIRLERYSRAVSKHGMKTTLGKFAQLWDSRSTILTAGTGVAVAVAAGNLWPAIVAGLAIAGRAVLEAKLIQIDNSTFKESASGREVAYLYEVQKKFSNAEKRTDG